MKRKLNLLRLGLLIVALGIGTILYPLTTMVVNQATAQSRMESFLAQEQPPEVIAQRQEQAEAYNQTLDGSANGAIDPFDMEEYATQPPISVPQGEIYAYVAIPKIGEVLPVYLGASDYHLSLGAAHVEGTNLPIGGTDTRAVIAAHRGYYTQPMFLNVDALNPGDIILIYLADEMLAYQVYGQEVIQPSEYGKLAVIPGEDVLTLLTCTLNLVDPDRVLVNAVRTELVEEPSSTEPETEPEANMKPSDPSPMQESADKTEPEPPAEMITEADHETTAVASVLAPSRATVIKKYGLIAVTAFFWLLLLVVLSRLMKTFFRNN